MNHPINFYALTYLINYAASDVCAYPWREFFDLSLGIDLL